MEHSFTTPDAFADDPSFRAYVRQSDPVAMRKWSEWLARHPDRLADVETATRLVQQLDTYQPFRLSDRQIEEEIQRVQAQISRATPDTFPDQSPPRSGSVRPRWRWPNQALSRVVAASVGALVIGLIAYRLLQPTDARSASPTLTTAPTETPMVSASAPEPLQAQTDYGQRRTVRLPDGSVVTLNAHSTLTLSPDWARGKREVALVGEAFFQVAKQQRDGQAVKFVVRANNVAVEVLGTQFDVSTRSRRVKVVLNEGRIRLKVLQNPTAGGTPTRTLDMLPGDLVEVTAQEAVTLDSRVETAEHSAWIMNELVFDDTPLAEIAEVINDNYGYTVQFDDPSLASRRLTATLPDSNLDVLLKALEKAFSLSITKTQKTIRLAKSV